MMEEKEGAVLYSGVGGQRSSRHIEDVKDGANVNDGDLPHHLAFLPFPADTVVTTEE